MNHSSEQNFEIEWNRSFPKKIPISNLFKHYFTKNWIRIYSLPNAKRYAKNQIELEQLVQHQNRIISDCFDLKANIYIVSGLYSYGDINSSHHRQSPLHSYDFKIGKPIHLHSIDPLNFDDGEKNDQYFTPHFAQSIWQQNIHNELLITIANDETDAFFICFKQKIIIAPYDGGIDLIVPNQDLINSLKLKYSQYTSIREDGL